MEEQSKRSFPPIIAILLVLVILFLAGFLYSKRGNLTNKKVETPTVVEPTKIPTALTLAAQNASVALGQPVVLTVVADSNKQDIVGFDVLVGYDSESFTFVSAESLDKNFRVFPKNLDTHLSVTGIKNAQVSQQTIFEGGELLRVSFTPKKKGSFSFSLQPKVGRETTKLVNADTQVLVPSVQNVTVEVR